MENVLVIMAAVASAENVSAVNREPLPEAAFRAFRRFHLDAAPEGSPGFARDSVIVAAAIAFAMLTGDDDPFTGDRAADRLILSGLILRFAALDRLVPELPADLVNPFAGSGAAGALTWAFRAALAAEVVTDGGWPPRFEREGFIRMARSLRRAVGEPAAPLGQPGELGPGQALGRVVGQD